MNWTLLLLLLLLTESTGSALDGWAHSGSIHILTTRDGAGLPSGATLRDFPLLVRLDNEWFPFNQAADHGEDLRIGTKDGALLSHEIEEWNRAEGTASVWVRVPLIKGNEIQELRLFWGRPDAAATSSGSSVFNSANGFLAVCHFQTNLTDATGKLAIRDAGSTKGPGIIGTSRHLEQGQGISCGEKIDHLPQSSEAHTTEAWVLPRRINSTIIGWGNEQAQGKVVLQYRSPPHFAVDGYFSDANVRTKRMLPPDEWLHLVHTYERGESKLYVNGVLDTVSKSKARPLNLKTPAKMWIGGWYNHYDFEGEIDEVRISSGARSADWVRLEFENQKLNQTAVGTLVTTGNTFSVTPGRLLIREGDRASVAAEADGALKTYWILKRGGSERVVATDRRSYVFDAGRTSREESATLEFKAIFPDGPRTLTVPIVIANTIPEPDFDLAVPQRWNGRTPLTIQPTIHNHQAMLSAGAAECQATWSLSGPAVIKESSPSKLSLTRSQGSGILRITCSLINGGRPSTRTVTMNIVEPARDPWIKRELIDEEMPQDNQFIAREDRNEGTIRCSGRLEHQADSVFLRVYADGKLFRTVNGRQGKDRSYAIAVTVRAGLIRYATEFGCISQGRELLLHKATNLVCGDAYIIQGQSNAVATDWGNDEPSFKSDWIRTFGSMSGGEESRLNLWGNATHRSRDQERLQIGYWGMEMARRLVEDQHIPICILNGAVGGTRVDQHQRNPENPEDQQTIYGRLLWRIRRAGLTHGIRGIFWHQGENDQGADGPTGGFGWETYRDYFHQLAAAWKQDYPNVQNYYVFQIWPKSCAMGVDGSDNRLREAQRQLPSDFAHMSIMSTLGIEPPGGCHFPAAGYAEFARLITPLVERDNYGRKFDSFITPPNLKRAWMSQPKSPELNLEFDQPVVWSDKLSSQFYLNGKSGTIRSGSASGNRLRLEINPGSVESATQISYLDSNSWGQDKLLRNKAGIAALTFFEVPIHSSQSGN